MRIEKLMIVTTPDGTLLFHTLCQVSDFANDQDKEQELNKFLRCYFFDFLDFLVLD